MKSQFLRYGGLILAFLVFFSPSQVDAQVRGSERSVLQQTISGTEVVVDYARPSVRGREPLFGGLEKWDHVWTPGADLATKIRFSKDVSLNDQNIDAGTYSVWMHLKENDPWVLMLHPDTTLFHVPPPTLDEAYLTVEAQPSNIDFYTETLSWGFEHIRADGAVVQFRWGATLLEFDLGVDPGVEITFESYVVEPFMGTWLVDRSMSRPPDSLITQWKADSTPEAIEGLDKWLTSLASPQEILLEYQPESGMLFIENSSEEEDLQEWLESRGLDEDYFQSLLIRKAAGIFSSGALMNGELTFGGDFEYWEFEFDDDGVAQSFVKRNARTDEVSARATRIERGE